VSECCVKLNEQYLSYIMA